MKKLQKSMANRIFTYVSIVLVFRAGQYVSVRWMGVSMMEYLEEEFAFVVGLVLNIIGGSLSQEEQNTYRRSYTGRIGVRSWKR